MSKNLSASVRQRLTNKAKETNRPFQELLQYFAMERFLYRLAQSPHAEKFILKGALMFTAWGGPPSRPTKDIDLLARMDNAVESVVALMREFEAMTKLGLLNSRMKDFYDLWILSRQFDFDGAALASAIQKTFANRKTAVLSRPTALTSEFGGDTSKQTQWQAFLRKTKLDGVPTTLQAVIDDLAQFLGPVGMAVESGSAFNQRWIARGPWQ
jgi:hypothetical protein